MSCTSIICRLIPRIMVVLLVSSIMMLENSVENVEKVLVDNIFLFFGRNIQIYNQLFYFLGKVGNLMGLLRRVINGGKSRFLGKILGRMWKTLWKVLIIGEKQGFFFFPHFPQWDCGNTNLPYFRYFFVNVSYNFSGSTDCIILSQRKIKKNFEKETLFFCHKIWYDRDCQAILFYRIFCRKGRWFSTK